MAYRCDRCGKGRLIGKNVSHSKKRTRKVSLPNLQAFKGILNGKKGKWRLCTKCLRTVKKEQVGLAEKLGVKKRAETTKPQKKKEKRTSKKA